MEIMNQEEEEEEEEEGGVEKSAGGSRLGRIRQLYSQVK